MIGFPVFSFQLKVNIVNFKFIENVMICLHFETSLIINMSVVHILIECRSARADAIEFSTEMN